MSISLPPSLVRSTAAQELAAQLDRATIAKRELRQEAAMAQSPIMASLSTQGGVAAAAGLAAYLPDRFEGVAFLGAIGCAVYGGYTKRPWLVSFGNGLAAPLVFDRVYKALTKNAEPPSSAEPAASAA